MPYKSIEDALKTKPNLKKYSDKAQRAWISAFNSAYKSGKPESSCFAIAYSVANKIDGKKNINANVENSNVTDDMINFFVKRTMKHINLVNDNVNKINKIIKIDGLNDIAKEHDLDKFSYENIIPYIWMTEYYRCKNNNINFKYPDGIEELCDNASYRHCNNNKHHPEFWNKHSNNVDFCNMSYSSIVEMCADWAAMSQEKGTSLKDWVDNNVNVKWKFSPERTGFIYKLINIFEPGEKEMNNKIASKLISIAKELMLSDDNNDLTQDDVELFCSSCSKKMKAKNIKSVKAHVIKKAMNEYKCAANMLEIEKILNKIHSPKGKLKFDLFRKSNNSVMVIPFDKNDLGLISSELGELGYGTELVRTISGKNAIRVSCVITADKWKKLPKGWTNDSLKKYWDTLVGDVKHKVTKCIEKLEGDIEDAGAFCASLADKIEGTEWRKEPRKVKKAKDNAYSEFFKEKLKEYNIKSPSELKTDEEKKEFFNDIEKGWKSKKEK